MELTECAQKITKNTINIGSDQKTRPGDIRIYVSDNSFIKKTIGWTPKKTLQQTLESIYKWINGNKEELKDLFS